MLRAALIALGAGILAACALALSTGSASAGTTTVRGGDYWFCDPSFRSGVCTTTVQQGDTVVWDFSGSREPHTSTECGASCDSPTSSPLWESGFIEPGGATFSFTFTTPGTYLYLCRVHPFDMRGRIVVEAAAQPTTAPGATAGPSPGAAPSSPSSGGLPPAGSGPQPRSTASWPFAVLAAAGAALIGAGLYARRPER